MFGSTGHLDHPNHYVHNSRRHSLRYASEDSLNRSLELDYLYSHKNRPFVVNGGVGNVYEPMPEGAGRSYYARRGSASLISSEPGPGRQFYPREQPRSSGSLGYLHASALPPSPGKIHAYIPWQKNHSMK
jgi:hypothetical protein